MIDHLAVYGTLAPGQPNAHVLAAIEGSWSTGTVTGHLREAGWGAELGYPGIVLDPAGPEVSVSILTSSHLDDALTELDAFEGPGYRRSQARVSTDTGSLVAWIYELAD